MSVQRHAGAPWLYDEVTGDIIGVKDPDRSEYYFARAFGSFYDTTDQTALANTATAMTFNTTDIASGVSIVSGSRIQVDRPGTYNVQFSAQLVNTDNQEHDASIWLRKNGSDVADSNTWVGVPATHGSFNGHQIAAWNFFIRLLSGEYVELYWSTPNVAVSIQQIPAQTAPVRPVTPSIILTVQQVA